MSTFVRYMCLRLLDSEKGFFFTVLMSVSRLLSFGRDRKHGDGTYNAQLNHLSFLSFLQENNCTNLKQAKVQSY